MHEGQKHAQLTTIEEIRAAATEVAGELRTAEGGSAEPASSGGGSLHRALPPGVRERFIEVRSALFRRGYYDPVLVRFDTATVPQAATAEVADRLTEIAAAL